MKALAISILIFLMAVQTFSKWLVLLEYRLNQNYFERVLCENKAKPELQCKGKCAVMKKMAEEDSSSQKDTSFKLHLSEETMVCNDAPAPVSPAASVRFLFPEAGPCRIPCIYLPSVFHPPLV
jgi:hypothetical protein